MLITIDNIPNVCYNYLLNFYRCGEGLRTFKTENQKQLEIETGGCAMQKVAFLLVLALIAAGVTGCPQKPEPRPPFNPPITGEGEGEGEGEPPTTVYYSLTTIVSPVNSGAIVTTPLSDNGQYAADTDVSLFADAKPGWKFIRWEGNLQGETNPMTLKMSGHMIAKAVFAQETVPEIIPARADFFIPAEGEASFSFDPKSQTPQELFEPNTISGKQLLTWDDLSMIGVTYDNGQTDWAAYEGCWPVHFELRYHPYGEAQVNIVAIDKDGVVYNGIYEEN